MHPSRNLLHFHTPKNQTPSRWKKRKKKQQKKAANEKWSKKRRREWNSSDIHRNKIIDREPSARPFSVRKNCAYPDPETKHVRFISAFPFKHISFIRNFLSLFPIIQSILDSSASCVQCERNESKHDGTQLGIAFGGGKKEEKFRHSKKKPQHGKGRKGNHRKVLFVPETQMAEPQANFKASGSNGGSYMTNFYKVSWFSRFITL